MKFFAAAVAIAAPATATAVALGAEAETARDDPSSANAATAIGADAPEDDESSSTRALASGCYPAYSAGSGYAAGEQVSIVVAKTTPDAFVACTTGSAGCVGGHRNEGGVTTTVWCNFECHTPVFCSMSGFTPGGVHSDSAWTKLDECTGTAIPATAPAPTQWSGGGCPKNFVGDVLYDAGDVVSVVRATHTSVFACNAEPRNQFCGMAGYEPSKGQYWSQAWTEVGSCSGTLAPTDSPSFEVLEDAGGCPKEYSSGTAYEEGDKIAKDGFIYQCKGFPASQHCGQAGYQPGVDIGGIEYWKEAWTITGYCSGTIAPTTSPNYVNLPDLGGCPDAWEAKVIGEDVYEEGDRISSQGLVFQCKAWPYSGHCGQAGYEPNLNPATPEAWRDAWSVVGYCNGSMGPTMSPTIDPATSLGACPDEWEAGIHTKYEDGDMVSIIVSATPLRKVAFRCKAWPYSAYCAQHAPGTQGGSLGWAVAGGCDGSIGPTQSPSFTKLSVFGAGCPPEWKASTTTYEAGDLVAYTISTVPMRKLVYECKPFPYNGFCNQGAGFEPGTRHASMAWTLEGACDGSMSPTRSPVQYIGACQYTRCLEDQDCTKNAPSNEVPGSTACSCTTALEDTSACSGNKGTQTVCTVEDVDPYNKNFDYQFGDIVRVGLAKYCCKDWPNGLWCKQEAYMPQLEPGIWSHAWSECGYCPTCGGEFLVARYGNQICPSEIEQTFTKAEFFTAARGGLQNLQPDFIDPLVDEFSTRGLVALTQEQAESVCLTKCRNNPKCGAVTVTSRPNRDFTGKMEHSCKMTNPSLGGAYLQDMTSLKEAFQAVGRNDVLFQKKSGARLPSFEEVQCNIDAKPAQLQTAVSAVVTCLFQGFPIDCQVALTDDFKKYFAPAIDCVFNKGGGGPGGAGAVQACLGCLTPPIGITKVVDLEDVRQICPTNAQDDTTIPRDTDICGSVCFPDDCEAEIATGLLCVMGSPPTTDGNTAPDGTPAIIGGQVNGGAVNFTCPSVN